MLSRRALGAGALRVLGGALAGGALAGCGDGLRGRLTVADAQPDDYPTVAGVRAFAAALERRTDGRLKCEIYPGAQLGAERDTLEITIFGGIDINRVNIAPLNSIAPETAIPALPFVFDSVAHMRRSVDGAPGDAILAALRPRRLIGLCFYDSGARSFYNTRRPIHTPEDMRGLKFRVQNSDLYVALVEALGGDATPMTFAEVYTALLQGVIDGAENNWPSYESTRHYEVAKHYSLTQHVMAPEVLLMSEVSWTRLSEDDQEAVVLAAKESVRPMRDVWDARVARSRAIVEESGVAVVEDIDKSLFSARMEEVWARFVRTPEMQRLVEDIRNDGDARV